MTKCTANVEVRTSPQKVKVEAQNTLAVGGESEKSVAYEEQPEFCRAVATAQDFEKLLL